MKDKDIRAALILYLRASDPDAALFNEMPLARGQGRADCAAVNGKLCGYEIKSANDSLARLKRQIVHYESIFEYCSVVVAPKHVKNVRKSVPTKWGIFCAEYSDGEVAIRSLRKPQKNAAVSPEAQLKLLWARELQAVLRDANISAAGSLISNLWESAERIPRRSISRYVRDALKSRDARLSAARCIPGGDSRTTEPTE